MNSYATTLGGLAGYYSAQIIGGIGAGAVRPALLNWGCKISP
jgi:hypothetical protein